MSPSPSDPTAFSASLSPEWEALNGRRLALIHKRYDGAGLTPDEVAELEQLKVATRAMIAAAFPAPVLVMPRLQALLDAKAASE